MTTRRRIRRAWWRLRHRPGTLPAHALRLSVLGFDRRVLATSRLALRRLPQTEQPSAFGILAVTLVPAPRLVSAAAALA